MRKKLLVSFSGGETSAYMAQWLWVNKRDEFDMVFVFANTGQENEETLLFTKKCSEYFGLPIYWLEGVYSKELGVGVRAKLVDFDTADRDGAVFEQFISVYGIPNQANPQCSKELKANVIKSFARNYLEWSKYYTAIGIREDEVDRVNDNARKLRILYPLISRNMRPMTKQKINFWWSQQPFRLNLKGYEGNCKWCWKKSLPKLRKIAHENPSAFDFPLRMEDKYGNFFPEHRAEKWMSEGKEIPKNITFFRGNTSAKDILRTAQDYKIVDDSRYDGHQLGLYDESCEVWSNCGEG